MAQIIHLQSPETTDLNLPVLFLAGPIQGADNWQAEAVKLIKKHADKDLIIANPRRISLTDKNFIYTEQVEWERRHLLAAGEGKLGGCILFWLCKEMEVIEGRSFAQTTRYELAEWITRHEFTKARLAIGIDEPFSGQRYIEHRTSIHQDIAVNYDLEATVLKALNKIS